MSSFSGLSVALSALQAQRRAMEVGGQNVANAGTAGYTRQRAELSALGPTGTYSVQGPPRTVGDGVEVSAVVRLSDEFAMARLRGQEADSAFLAARSATFEQVETRFAEPGDNGLTAQLAELWGAWGDVANHPGDEAARSVLMQQSQAVVDQIAAGYAGVSTQWDQLRDQTASLVNDLNTTAESVAALNKQITAAIAVGAPVNELSDERDRLVLKLSQLSGAAVRPQADGSVDVLLGGSELVQGEQSRAVAIAAAGPASVGEVTPTSTVFLTWADGSPAAVTSGRIGANLGSLGETLPNAAQGYDAVAKALATEVNALQESGFDLTAPVRSPGNPGKPFFAGETALELTVAITHPNEIAASAGRNQRLDGSVANAITKLATAAGGPTRTWETLVVDIGVQAQAAARRAASSELIRNDAEAAWTSATSVDVDEEMVNLVAVQRAYEGAARMLTAVDQALDTLINRTGLVGR